MKLSDLNVKLRLDTSEIDTAIEKANLLLALLLKIRGTGSQTEVSFKEAKGHWIHEKFSSDNSVTGFFYLSECHCSECGCYVQQESNFCPNCGTNMRAETKALIRTI